MSDNSKTWRQEQEENHMFRGQGRGGGNDADRMLELSRINLITYDRQAKLKIGVRGIGRTMQLASLEVTASDVEYSQMAIDAESRHNFMKVAIEQWQAKLAALKRKALETYIQ